MEIGVVVVWVSAILEKEDARRDKLMLVHVEAAHHAAAKQQHPDALLFFRLGDFYEMFFEDAQIASKELQLTLTSRDKERGIQSWSILWRRRVRGSSQTIYS